MRFRSILSTFALAGALAGSAYAHGTLSGIATSEDELAVPHADALTQPDSSPGNGMPEGEFASVAWTVEPRERDIVEGEVAAVERGSGRFVLDTDEGLIGFVTSPDELEGVEIGDVVRVSFLVDESD